MGVFSFIIIIVALVTFGEVCSKWLEAGRARQAVAPPPDDGEVLRLREQVESLADQVDKLTEEQRFLTRLLEASPRSQALPSGESRSGAASGPPPEGPS